MDQIERRVWELDLMVAALGRRPREFTAEERARFEIPDGARR